MKLTFLFSFFFLFCNILIINAQEEDSLTIQGYVFEENNRGYLNEVAVQIYLGEQKYGEPIFTNRTGEFKLRVPSQPKYKIVANKTGFYEQTVNLDNPANENKEALFPLMKMRRLPGYVLDFSIMEDAEAGEISYSIEGATIEIYNRTLMKEELRLENYNKHALTFLLEQGNEYIFMIRKEGYYTKRLRANVNVNGCILCMEGFGSITPGVVENLTEHNTKGSLITSVELKKMVLNETVKVTNIYYDFGKATLRDDAKEQLDLLAEMLKDNPTVEIELASHTDCRGSNKDNLELSQKRADNVVNYVRKRVNLNPKQITGKGYGESKPLNSCVDGVDCSEELHQVNRRTEFTVTGIQKDDYSRDRTLASIMQEENMDRLLDATSETYVEEFNKETKDKKTPTKPDPIPMRYTGYKIELLQMKNNPTMDHPIFMEFDKLYLDIDGEGAFSFMVGDFKDKAAAEKKANKYKKSYETKIISYKDGFRQ